MNVNEMVSIVEARDPFLAIGNVLLKSGMTWIGLRQKDSS